MKKIIISSALIGTLIIPQSIGTVKADGVINSSTVVTTRINSKSSLNNSLSSNVENYWNLKIRPFRVTTNSGKMVGVGENEAEYLKTFGTGTLDINIEIEYQGDTGIHEQTVQLPSGVYTKNSIENAPINIDIYTAGGHKHTIKVGYYFCDKYSKVIHVVMDSNKLQDKLLDYSTPSKVGNNYQFYRDINNINVVSQSYIDSLNLSSSSITFSSRKNPLSSKILSSSLKSSSLSSKNKESKVNSNEHNSIVSKSSIKKSNISSKLENIENSTFNGNIHVNPNNRERSKVCSLKNFGNSLGESSTKSSLAELKLGLKQISQIENGSSRESIKHQYDLNVQRQTKFKQKNSLKANSNAQKLPQTGTKSFNVFEFMFDLFK